MVNSATTRGLLLLTLLLHKQVGVLDPISVLLLVMAPASQLLRPGTCLTTAAYCHVPRGYSFCDGPPSYCQLRAYQPGFILPALQLHTPLAPT
jgi:hypothetical protein